VEASGAEGACRTLLANKKLVPEKDQKTSKILKVDGIVKKENESESNEK